MFFEFLCCGKPPRVKKSTIINYYDNGGLKMPGIYSIYTCQKLMWLKRLTNDKENLRHYHGHYWELKNIFWTLNLLKTILVARTKFYQQLLDCWFNMKTCPRGSAEEILHEYLLYNRFIKLGGSSLTITKMNNNI